MAFSMKNISRWEGSKNKFRSQNFKKLFTVIKLDGRLTPNVATALNIYVEYLLKVGATTGYSKDTSNNFDDIKLKQMIDELLVGCCDNVTRAVLITKDSVFRAEDDIICQVKDAIRRVDKNHIYSCDKNDNYLYRLIKMKERATHLENISNKNTKVNPNSYANMVSKEDMMQFLMNMEEI